MLIECAVLGASSVIVKDAVTIEYLKSKQLDLSNQEKKEFLEDKSRRFVHFTSKESAEKIIESGFVLPTKGRVKNHFTKVMDGSGKKKDSDMVYMFDSATFNVDDYIRNLPKERSPFNGCYEYYAVSTKPDEHELSSFKRRVQDGAITYDGRLDLDGTDTRIQKYVLGLDEHGEYTLNEVPMDYKYTPSDELKAKLSKDKMGNLRYTLKTYYADVKKARETAKTFRVQKEEYKDQIQRRKDFAKANRQFIEEEKDKSYVFKKDGRTIVVKNIEYEEIGGKKLQKIAIFENTEENKRKKALDVAKFCYMDEYDLSNIDSRVGADYFFNNLDIINEKQSSVPEYIGLPIENLETGEVTNEYDTKFRQYMERRQNSKYVADKNFNELKNSKKLTTRIKSLFSKVFGKKKEVAMLGEGLTPEEQDRRELAKLGYSSVQAMNADDKEAEMYSLLSNQLSDDLEIYSFNEGYDEQRKITEKVKEEI